MKRINLLYVLVLLFSLPLFLGAQDVGKEVKVKMVKVVDGKKTVIDTVFASTSDVKQQVQLVIDQIDDIDSVGNKVVRIEIVSDGSENQEQEYEVIVYSGDETDQHVFLSSPHGRKKMVKWMSEEGDENEFELSMELENLEGLSEDIQREVEDAMRQSEDAEREMIIVNGERMKWMSMPPRPPRPPHPVRPMHPGQPENMYFFHEEINDGGTASQEELRDAGIKSQPDQLVLTTLDIDNRNGVITLRFMPKKDEGSPKVTVYNFFGDKVYSQKAELAGDVYQQTIDLSAKQPGTYFIQIVQKKSSVTQRIRL